MTEDRLERLTALAHKAWPDVARIRIHQHRGEWLAQSVMGLDFGVRLAHRNLELFEAALTVLALPSATLPGGQS